jgi:hypothetical protein
VRQRDLDDEHRPPEVADERRRAEPEPSAGVLELQRAIGNRAVTSLLARQPPQSPTAPPAPQPVDHDRAATVTCGLGDDIGVIPVDSFSWGEGGSPGSGVGPGKAEVHEVSIVFVPNPAAPMIAEAAAKGTPIPSAFLSTTGMTATMSDVLLSRYSESGDTGSGGAVITVTLNFKDIEFKPVR